MRYVLCFLFLLLSQGSMTAQEVSFTVEITSDTLYFGNILGLKYTISNTQGDFEPPSFEGFDVIGGPNVSSQFSMVNGAVTQSASYEYYLMPREIGTIDLPSAILKNDTDELTSDEVRIIVVDNPEGIQQSTSRYGLTKSNSYKPAKMIIDKKPMSKQDSLIMKLKKVKAKKI